MVLNPFSTRCVRPGAIPFLFADGTEAGSLLERLRASGWWGQIFGPHGSGKSTLLASLRPLWEAEGRSTVWVELHDGQRRLPRDAAAASLSAGTQLAIDGYEQLSRWTRAALARQCRRTGCGLIVTAHADAGLPTLWETAPDWATARRLVAHLAPDGSWLPDEPELARLFAGHGGNVREFLFAMYDLYESRAR